MKNRELELAISALNAEQLNNLSGTIALKIFKNKRALKAELEDVMEQTPKTSEEFSAAISELVEELRIDNPGIDDKKLNELVDQLAQDRIDEDLYNARVEDVKKFSDLLNSESLVELKKITEDELINLTIEQMSLLDFMIE